MIQIPMDMPKTCYECYFNQGEYTPDEYEKRSCCLKHRPLYKKDYKNRPKDCPIVEKKQGKWVTIWNENDPYTSSSARCSICNRVGERPLGQFCKWCGTEMDSEEQEEFTNRTGFALTEKGGEVGMSETMVILCVLGIAAFICIIGLIRIHFQEKEIEKKTGRKPTYTSPVGDWLRGKRW